MDLIERVSGHFRDSIAIKQQVMDELSPAVALAAERMVSCLMNEGKILACGNGGSADRVHLVIPKSFNDAQQVADKFRDGIPVVLNLQSTDSDLSKRLIDFTSGLTYGLDGGMQKIAEKVFMLTPRNVEISAEERASLIEKGFFNQS